jgi:hypothetical protein
MEFTSTFLSDGLRISSGGALETRYSALTFLNREQSVEIGKRGAGAMPFIIALILALMYFSGWGFFAKHYAAEVGYYQGKEIAWDLWGDFTSLDECRNEAIGRYNLYYAQNQRAYTWSCLEKNGKGGYTSRHR